jgi:hypothetical protein
MARSVLAGLVGVAVIGFCASPCSAVKTPEASEDCGECHKAIHETWSTSSHARSLEDPAFLASYRRSKTAAGEGLSRLCLRCHAPLAEITGDWELAARRTWEGVSCDVCHSIVSVDVSSSNPRQVLEIGEVKRGPISDAQSEAHEVAYSPLHATSAVCAGCHQFANSEGTPILTTYTEWQGSGAAKSGKSCQSCHMARVRGDVVDPKVARVEDARINMHEVPGGHSLDQLHKALSVGIDARHDGDSLHVEVRIVNKGAGHAVPTGMPGRRVILDVNLRTSEGKTYQDGRVYAKFFVDTDGSRIGDVWRYFADGVREESDSRILPDERRVESFSFPVPPNVTAQAKVQLHYEYTPLVGPDEPRTVSTFVSESRTFGPHGVMAR